MRAEIGGEREAELLEAYREVARDAVGELAGILELAVDAKLISLSIFEPEEDDLR